MQLAELGEQRHEVDATMGGRVGREPANRLRQLALGCDGTASPRLIPRDRDVHEALKEVAFLRRRGAPLVLELLVRGEVLAGADQREPALELRL